MFLRIRHTGFSQLPIEIYFVQVFFASDYYSGPTLAYQTFLTAKYVSARMWPRMVHYFLITELPLKFKGLKVI